MTRSRPRCAENATHIYAIRARFTPFVKIGVTSDPEGRIKRIQTETPHAVRFVVCVPCERAYDVEQWVHEQLRRCHVRGEWFWLYRNGPVAGLIARGLVLSERGEIPSAPTPIQKHASIKPERTVRLDRTIGYELLDRLEVDRTRVAIIELMVYSGWATGEIRAIIKGDNGAIGIEVEAAKKRLGIVDEPRQLKVRDEKGERLIPMEAP